MRLEPLQSRRSGADLAFSLSLSLSLSPQNFPAAGVGDRRCISLCFLAIRFHARVVILTSIKSHFWSSLGHRGHCCVFVVVFGLFGTQSSAGCHFFLLCCHFCKTMQVKHKKVYFPNAISQQQQRHCNCWSRTWPLSQPNTDKT